MTKSINLEDIKIGDFIVLYSGDVAKVTDIGFNKSSNFIKLFFRNPLKTYKGEISFLVDTCLFEKTEYGMSNYYSARVENTIAAIIRGSRCYAKRY